MDRSAPPTVREFPRLAGGAALAIALLGLGGWVFRAPQLTSVFAGWATMKANTALAVGLLGLALVASQARRACALGALLLAAAAAFEWASGVDLRVDQLLIADPMSAAQGEPPGRMAPATALAVGAAAGALVLRPGPWAHGAAMSCLTVCWLAGVALVYELGPLTGVATFRTMSVPTVAALTAVAFGTLLLAPDRGPAAAFLARDGAGTLARRLGPLVVFGPVLALWPGARWASDGARGFVLAAGVTGLVAVFGGALWATAATLRASERQVAAVSQKLIDAAEEERRRLAREIHDELGQTVATLGLLLDRDRPTEARPLVGDLAALLRELALDLRPALLDDHGVAPAVTALAQRVQDRAGMQVQVEIAGETRYRSAVETAVYRIVQESLTNAMRHASARRVHVRLALRANGVELRVKDDGVGFAPGSVASDRSGLAGMAERARLVGGWLEVAGGPAGAEVRAWLPA